MVEVESVVHGARVAHHSHFGRYRVNLTLLKPVFRPDPGSIPRPNWEGRVASTMPLAASLVVASIED